MMGNTLDSGIIEAPEDGPVAWTTHAVIAILLNPGTYEGPTPPLTASETYDLAALARIASEITGRPIERKLISDNEQRARLAPRGVMTSIISFYLAARNGEFATLDPT